MERIRIAFGCSAPSLTFVASLLITCIACAQTAVLPPVWHWSNPLPHGADVFGIAYADGEFVQVCEKGQIFISDDLISWTPASSHTTASLRAAAYFGSRLVVTGESGTVLFSDDLSDFYLLNLNTSDWLEGLAASTNLLVAVGDNAAQ